MTEKVRVAVVGAAGAFGMKHLDGLAQIDDAEVTVVSGTRPEPTQAVAERYGVPAAVVGLDAVLERDDVDAVILATPTQMHAAQTQAVLAAGKHVQVEIPLADSLADAQATLAVPQYVADAGLKTFADIARFKDKLGGKIYGIEPGSGANTDIQKMIDTNRFGLGGFKLVASGEAGMLAAVQRAVNRKEFVVFVGWTPHPMNINMKITYLTGSEDVYGPNEGAATVSTVTAPDYAERCPNVHRLLQNLTFTAAQESQLMVPIMARKTPQEVAKNWLREHPEDLQRWLAGVSSFDGKDGVGAVQASLKN